MENSEQSKLPQSQPSRTKKILVGLVVFIAVFVVARFVWFPYSPEGRRLARINDARIHARTVVKPLLVKDIRFNEVRVSEWYKGDGYFLVLGEVETESDLKDLKSLVMATHPPAPVAWVVDVIEKNTGTNILKN